MSPVELAALSLSGAATLVIVGIALRFRSGDPEKALHAVEHVGAALQWVMAGRYLAFAILAIAATSYGDFFVISGLFAVFAFLGFYDTILYARIGAPATKHLWVGLGSLLVAGVAFLAANGVEI